MTKKPQKTLSAAIHREQPAVKVKTKSGRMVPGNENSKTTEIFTLPLGIKTCKNSGNRLMVLFGKTDKGPVDLQPKICIRVQFFENPCFNIL